MLDSRPPPSPFASPLIADPTQEAVEKVGRDFLKAPGGLLSNESTVSKSRVESAEYSKQSESPCATYCS
jgi:hypothetical protein